MLITSPLQTLLSHGQRSTEASLSVQVEPLTEADQQEALAFLAERPVHTVILAGWLREHGVESSARRGTFYGCRNAEGALEGVALIGRATMFETRTEAALLAFTKLARQCPSVQMVMGEVEKLKVFWSNYSSKNAAPRLVCHALLYEFTQPDKAWEGIEGLRQATLDDLDEMVAAHAEMVLEETGINPLDTDSVGFRQRCALRIAQGKAWAVIRGGELIFKADVVSETPETAYLEGLWVKPEYRHKGYGRLCWTALKHILLARAPSFCGFVNVDNHAAQTFYEKAGGILRGRYDKVYL